MSSSEEEIDGFHINSKYAEKYDRWREKEELQKLKDKYGNVSDVETSSSSESEDEDAEALTAEVEKEWLRALAAIKSKDPKIYDPSVKFFSEEGATEEGGSGRHKKKTKDKPFYLKDYDRKIILEKSGVISEDDDDDDDINKKTNDPSYYEEQEEIKQSLKAAIGDLDDSDDEDFLIPRKKDKEEEEREEEEYLLWLKGQKQELDTDKKVGIVLDPLRQYWNKPDLNEGEKFLRDYFLEKQYLDDEEEDDRIPTYEEIVQDEDISEEEKEIEREEEFERKYNFRFEEPDPEFIKSYPRTIADSVRQKKDKRAQKRKADRERKKKEKEKKMEELKQLKNLKKKEILKKLQKLKEITGNPTVGFTEEDIEGDFDPVKYDKVMKTVFDDGYYMDVDGEKPVFSDDEELELDDEHWDEWQCNEHHYNTEHDEELDEEDEGSFNMDDDYVPNQGVIDTKQKNKKSMPLEKQKHAFSQDEHGDEWQGTSNGDDMYDNVKREHTEFEEEDGGSYSINAEYVTNQGAPLSGPDRKRRKKKSMLAQALEKKKPVFNPGEKSFDEYFDEYYKLDYEDIIGDLPCRFKYRNVVKNDFGLDTAEVLTCPDRELNAWVSLKKMTQYRTEEEEEYDRRLYRKKAHQFKKKMHILPSLFKNDNDDPTETVSRKTKRKRKKNKSAESVQASTAAQHNFSFSLKTERRENKEENNYVCSYESKLSTGDAVKSEQHDSDGKTSPLKKIKDTPVKHSKLKPQKKRKKDSRKTGSRGFNMSDDRLKSYGIDPRKFKYTVMKQIHEKKPKSTT